jgi:phospholipase/carboxylesterase
MKSIVIFLILFIASGGLFAQVPASPTPLQLLENRLDQDLRIPLSLRRAQADQAYGAGQYDQAAALYLDLLQYAVEDGNSLYNLACCYGLMSDSTRAAKFLAASFRAGFDDLEHVRLDPDFTTVQGSVVFRTTVDSLDRVQALKQGVFGEITHIRSEFLSPCRVCLPPDYDSHKTYRLVIGLHGYGDNADHFSYLWSKFMHQDFIFVIPEAGYPFDTGKSIGYSWNVRDSVADKVWDEEVRQTGDFVLNVAREMKARYRIGDVYLLGFSQGCSMTYNIGLKHPKDFRGIICFAGMWYGNTYSEADLKAARGLRVFIAHGSQDRMVPLENSIHARTDLLAHGFQVEYVEFNGPHTVDSTTLKQAEAWMKS